MCGIQVDEGRKKVGDTSLAPRHALDDPTERHKNMFTQLSDTNKTVVLFILALVMALMPNTNVLSSPCSVDDPEPGGEDPYGGSWA